MKIATINGSARPGSYTGKALAIAQDEFYSNKRVQLTVIEPRDMKLSIPGSKMDGSDSKLLQDMVRQVDGLLLATPEYHGSFSSLMKLTIENLGFPSVLKEKPVVILGVAAGRIGAIKSIENLRSVSSHVGALALPMSVSIAHVRTVFDEAGNCLDAKIEEQIRKLAQELMNYIKDVICPRISVEEWVRNNE